jgi:PAS domain S-box-containing protein
MNKSRPTYRELEKRLAAAEPIVEVLKRHEVDAVVGEEKIAFLLLRGVEEALQDSDAAFNAMFKLSGIGMVQANTPALRFTKVNQKFCEIVGYSAKELLTRTYISLTHPQDSVQDLNGLARVLRGETDSWSIEKRCVRKDGSLIWVGVNGTALRDDTGRTVRIVAMISDITARKQAEPEQRDAKKESKKRVQNAAVKKAGKSASQRSSDKPRLKRR